MREKRKASDALSADSLQSQSVFNPKKAKIEDEDIDPTLNTLNRSNFEGTPPSLPPLDEAELSVFDNKLDAHALELQHLEQRHAKRQAKVEQRHAKALSELTVLESEYKSICYYIGLLQNMAVGTVTKLQQIDKQDNELQAEIKKKQPEVILSYELVTQTKADVLASPTEGLRHLLDVRQKVYNGRRARLEDILMEKNELSSNRSALIADFQQTNTQLQLLFPAKPMQETLILQKRSETEELSKRLSEMRDQEQRISPRK